ncbi:MAG: hypothetical protein JMN26_09985 [gamma proteobacterium endosymbiont of Lamellibrachia anaximandri]|nr:hypothetical protein [gamma proteobacterium endosymbiont of Lamellibrachia anaximandri]MBL3618051.1 hypothetical protein [gamma proteobacterium endosymbiont of Lamellibrachia anaximandri]
MAKLHNLNGHTVSKARPDIRDLRVELMSLCSREGSGADPHRLRELLDDYIDYLDTALSEQGGRSIDVSQIQEMLLEVSQIIRSGRAGVSTDDYRNIISHLTGIYAKGLAEEMKCPFIITSVDYADVIEAISHEYPAFDYREVMGQLLYYMSQLFRNRKGSWMMVYEHLLSLPESIDALALSNRKAFTEIQEWTEQGVDSLFQICRDYKEMVGQTEHDLAGLERRIAVHKDEMKAQQHRAVIAFDSLRKKRVLKAMLSQKARLIEALRSKQMILELVEDDIREFEEKLVELRRAYFIRLV